mmetsp:Transcript_32741/g.54280  ORF Transcript_32741/g.54280 Transcript_32741/m.54280 type:complete len:223 (+) Transcript_32741:314-982(+)
MRLPRPLPGAEAPASPFLNTLSSLAAICSTQPATSSGVRGHSFPLLGCRQRPCGCWGVGCAATSLPSISSGLPSCCGTGLRTLCCATASRPSLSFNGLTSSSGTGLRALGLADTSSLPFSSGSLPACCCEEDLKALGCAATSLLSFSTRGLPTCCGKGAKVLSAGSASCVKSLPTSLICCWPSLDTSTWKSQLRMALALSVLSASPLMVWIKYSLFPGLAAL